MGIRPDPTLVALVQALADEERLIADLILVLRRQREAIARDDLDGLDESVFSTHRVLLTLGEARRHRSALNHRLGETDDLSMHSLEETFGGVPPLEVRAAMDALAAAGQVLQREIDLNQRVLRVAVDAGDQLVRALCGTPDAPASYTPGPAHTGDGTLFDRRI